MKILYVEDNVADVDLVRRFLARLSLYSLDVATDVHSAMARLKAPNDFDLVLSDLRLPDGSGLDLLAWIRDQNFPTAVVILTGSGDQDAAVAALKTGADDYIVKQGEYLQTLPKILQSACTRHRDEIARKARPLRVLYVEHNTFDADLTRRHLAQYSPHIHLEIVGDADQAIERLMSVDHGSDCDVLLLDYQLPGLSALEAIKVMQQKHGIVMPMVLVTGQGNEELAVQALRLGFSDYMVKQPGYLHQLPFALESAYHRAQLKREQVALKISRDRYQELVTRASRWGFTGFACRKAAAWLSTM